MRSENTTIFYCLKPIDVVFGELAASNFNEIVR